MVPPHFMVLLKEADIKRRKIRQHTTMAKNKILIF